MKALIRGLAFAATALSAAAPAQAQTLKDFLQSRIALWNTPTEPFHVIGNVYYIGTKGIAAYLITGPAGNILIDTAMPEATGQIKANIQKLGFHLADIKLILNTHAHFDHTGGFAEIKRETGAGLVAGAADKPLLEGGYYPGQENADELKFPAVKVDRAVRDGDVVTLGPLSLTAHATPGHSPGCTSWTMDVTEDARPHKIIFFCSATVALNQLVKSPTYPGIVEDYRSTFKRAPLLEADVFLAPHPEMYNMEEKRAQIAEGKPNPFVKAGEFQAYVASLQTAFEDALAKQAQAASADSPPARR
jgi:metallo-beta-lactamase class B